MATFGETLKRERELRKITLREVSEATKIGLRYLEALESNHFDCCRWIWYHSERCRYSDKRYRCFSYVYRDPSISSCNRSICQSANIQHYSCCCSWRYASNCHHNYNIHSCRHLYN